MKRGLPASEIQRLDRFYDDYGLWQGWLKRKEPGEESPDDLGDWDAERIQGDLNQ